MQQHDLHDVGGQHQLQYVLVVEAVEGQVAGGGSLGVQTREGHSDRHQVVEHINVNDTLGVVSLPKTIAQ